MAVSQVRFRALHSMETFSRKNSISRFDRAVPSFLARGRPVAQEHACYPFQGRIELGREGYGR
jgi:hypothetical protein